MALPPPPPPAPPMSAYSVEQGGPRGPPGAPVSGFIVCMNVINTITHLLLGGVAFSAFLFVATYNELVSNWLYLPAFSAHICLNVIGYVLMMSQAILAFNPHTGWANNLKYPEKKRTHLILQVLGSILAISGSAVAMAELPVERLSSAHGITGFVALLFTVVSLVGGIANLIFPTQMSTTVFKTLHSCVGCLTIILAYIALGLGFDYVRTLNGNSYANLSIAITIFALLGTVMMAITGLFKRACSVS